MELEGHQTRPFFGDVKCMPIEDNLFNVFYSFGVLHHTDHLEKSAKEIRRVLRPGGQAIISVYHRDGIFFLARTYLVGGILRGRFLRFCWKRTLARTETGAGDDFIPTANVLSRGSLKQLFSDFSNKRLQCNHAALPVVVLSLLRYFFQRWNRARISAGRLVLYASGGQMSLAKHD